MQPIRGVKEATFGVLSVAVLGTLTISQTNSGGMGQMRIASASNTRVGTFDLSFDFHCPYILRIYI